MSNQNMKNPNSSTNVRWNVLLFLFVYALLIKLMPYIISAWGIEVHPTLSAYPWNFSPFIAICLFGGAVYPHKWMMFSLPLLVMLCGDLGIYLISGKLEWVLYPAQLFVYLSVALCAAFGLLLRKNRSLFKVGGVGLASCLMFFFATNGAFWLTMGMYPATLNGLVECLIAGIPFLKMSLMSTALFGAVLFSPICLVEASEARTQPQLAKIQ